MEDSPDNLIRIGVRAQDIQTSIQDADLGPLNAEVKNIRLVGMAARLAIHVRGADVIDDYRRLEYVSSQFGIDSLILPTVLNVLEELEWLRVTRTQAGISKVEENVPYFSDIYQATGQYFTGSHPTEVERAVIAITDRLALTPCTEEDIRKATGLDNQGYSIVLDLGRTGRFIEDYVSRTTHEKVLYSPLYWEENPEKLERVFQLLKEFGAEAVLTALSHVRSYQGMPLPENFAQADEHVLSADHIVLREAIRRGIVLAPEVSSHRGARAFAFTPQVGITLTDKVILEKAMAVLSCVRYGEHFGTITRIRFPEAILNSIIAPPHRIGSHTEIKKQYAILVTRGMGKVYPDSQITSRYYFELFPTEENIAAVKLARDLLRVGEVLEEKGLAPEARDVLFYHGSYQEAARTLPKLRRPAMISPRTREAIFNIINDTMDKLRGAP